MELPLLNKIYADLDKDKYEIVAVNLLAADSIDSAMSTYDSHSLTYTVLLDATGSVATDYKVRGVPTNVVIRPDGTVYSYNAGMLTEDMVREYLEDAWIQSGGDK